MNAKDLAREFPRSPFDILGDFPWLPRLVDKVRSKQAGTLGSYNPYPCGADKRFIAHFGFDTNGLEAVIASGASDDEIAAWCKANAKSLDFAAYRKFQFAPIAEERRPILEEYRAEVLAEKPDLDLSGADNFNKVMAIEEGHPIPKPAV